jgi:UDP-glucuronate 4-epimerase
MRTTLVTGSAGFIGSHLVDALLARGDKVVGVDNFDNYYSRSHKEANISGQLGHPNFTFHEADICDQSLIMSLGLSGLDSIVHFAGRGGVRPSIADPESYAKLNVGGTRNMLDMAAEYGVPQFVFASSSSVYGINPNVPWCEDDDDLCPISPYAETKIAGERLGHQYSRTHGIRFLALRFFTVYGPRQRPDLAIRKFAEKIQRGDEIQVYGDGSSRRDYTWIGDIVKGVMAGVDYRDSLFEVINLGNNQTVSLHELIEAIEIAVGRKANIERMAHQPGDVPQTWARNDKAQNLLGFAPNTPLNTGLEEFVSWLNSQPKP